MTYLGHEMCDKDIRSYVLRIDVAIVPRHGCFGFVASSANAGTITTYGRPWERGCVMRVLITIEYFCAYIVNLVLLPPIVIIAW